MSLLTICNRLALNVGLRQTNVVLSSGQREWQEAATLLDEVGDELARRVDWGELTKTVQAVGTQPITMPDDFSRMVAGVCAVRDDGAIVRPLTRAEWAALPDINGVPRYFLLSGDQIEFWPYLEASSVKVIYQSDVWRANGAREWQSDEDEALLDEDLMTRGLIARWRRKMGMPFEDEEAEYEQAVADLARFNDRSRLG